MTRKDAFQRSRLQVVLDFHARLQDNAAAGEGQVGENVAIIGVEGAGNAKPFDAIPGRNGPSEFRSARKPMYEAVVFQ